MFLAALWTPTPAPGWCSLLLLRHLVQQRARGSRVPMWRGEKSFLGKETSQKWPVSKVLCARGQSWLVATERGHLWLQKWRVWEEGLNSKLSFQTKPQCFGIVLAVGRDEGGHGPMQHLLPSVPIEVCEIRAKIQGFQSLCEPWRTLASHKVLVLPRNGNGEGEGEGISFPSPCYHPADDSSEVRVSAVSNEVSGLP